LTRQSAAGDDSAQEAQMSIDPRLRERLLNPEPAPGPRPDLGGQLRCRPEDFLVDEVPAYGPDGTPEAHLLLVLEKRGWNTEDALCEVARQLGVPRPEIGCAGLKDRHALTRQWISLPAAAGPRLGSFQHPELRLGEARPHGHKLRRGHLRGNRFEIVLREPRGSLPEALAALRERVAGLEAQGGLANLFGRQRFGRGGANFERGLALLQGGRRPRSGDLALSALQAAVFNLILLRRREQGLLGLVLAGDLLRKRESGGLFICEDPVTDQARLDAGELVLTAPLPGARQRQGPPGSPSRELEDECLARLGLERGAFAALGKKLPGGHRDLFVPLEGFAACEEPPAGGLGPGLRLRFTLPAGSFATRLLVELGAGEAEDPVP
jgi:tRNA pseudouridine13 synthase